MGKPRGRWEVAVWKDAVDLLQIRNWKLAARKAEVWMKEIGEAMDRKWDEASYVKKKKKKKKKKCGTRNLCKLIILCVKFVRYSLCLNLM